MVKFTASAIGTSKINMDCNMEKILLIAYFCTNLNLIKALIWF